jgi:hypothetical protein
LQEFGYNTGRMDIENEKPKVAAPGTVPIENVIKISHLEGTNVSYPMLNFTMFADPDVIRDYYDLYLSSRNTGMILHEQSALREFEKRTGLNPLDIHNAIEQKKIDLFRMATTGN